MSSPTPPRSHVFPSTARWRTLAVALLIGQALVLVGFAVAWLVGLVRGTAEYPQAVVGLAVVALVAAGIIALAARGVHRVAAWTRAPVITFQLLLGVMGVEWVRGEAAAIGIGAVVVAATVTVAMLRPGVVAQRGAPAGD